MTRLRVASMMLTVLVFAGSLAADNFRNGPRFGDDGPAEPRPVRNSAPRPPAEDDLSADSLRRYHRAVERQYGGYRNVPLELKAQHLSWAIERYHMTPWRQINPRVVLPKRAGKPLNFRPGADISTWNGAFLSALSYEYAVTKSPQTLKRIEMLIRGIRLFFTVTGEKGLPARCVLRKPIPDFDRSWIAADKTKYYYKSDAAKGTVNQLTCGLIDALTLAGTDMRASSRRLAQRLLSDMAYHLVRHDYKLTEANGKETKYGDLTPKFGPQGIPFNAQLAYLVVAGGAHFPSADARSREKTREAYEHLRFKHHVYYENPFGRIILPQRVGASVFVKGMNDRNHVCNAAYHGLMLERWAARNENRRVDRKFAFELGRTMYWTLRRIENEGNALCNFMWAGILSDPEMREAIVPGDKSQTLRQIEKLKGIGWEQLRRFPVDRFFEPGEEVATRDPQWVDAHKKNESYMWKSGPFTKWRVTGPADNTHTASIDFLYAYWLARFWRLDTPPRQPIRSSSKSEP